jgi:hypothetical protein
MIRKLVNGSASGVLATAAMSAVMLAADRAGLMGEQPPKRIVRGLLPGHKHRPKPGEGVLGAATHFAFGAGAGTLFSLVVGAKQPRVPLGITYGLAIWAVSYQGWVPALGIMPPAHRDRPERQSVMALAHVVYGSALVLALNRLSRGEHIATVRGYPVRSPREEVGARS